MTMKKFKNSVLLSLVVMFAVAGTVTTLDAANPQVKSRKTQVKKKSTSSKGTTTAKTQSTASQGTSSNGQTFTVKGVRFKMIHVDGASFSIGQTEVTQALWKAVMGNNPSKFKGDNLPVEQLTWSECQSFIAKLNKLTGRIFRLPTAPEWEFAASGGCKKSDYDYAGSYYIDKIAWYKGNSGGSTHKVATKQPNQLGIYDMTGNVNELCGDDDDTARRLMGMSHPLRGGAWCDGENLCLIKGMYNAAPNARKSSIGFRLALDDNDKLVNTKIETKTINVKGETIEMVGIVGGTFSMGATPEQTDCAREDEKPVHQVTLSDYYIGKYEVTQALWEKVMGWNRSWGEGDIYRPVNEVTWKDCQVFIAKLNELTGEHFRLPTEAEWEYAARGGNRSKNFLYAGSNKYGDVAWGDYIHQRGRKAPNELGLYDMTGNVFEWCQDWAGAYTSEPQTNPKGPALGSRRIIRGGAFSCTQSYGRVSSRGALSPEKMRVEGGDIGLRLAMDAE